MDIIDRVLDPERQSVQQQTIAIRFNQMLTTRRFQGSDLPAMSFKTYERKKNRVAVRDPAYDKLSEVRG